MRHGRVRWLMSLPVALMLVSASPPAVAQDGVAEAFCQLLTAKEVREVLGTKVEATADPTGCTWSSTKAGELAAASAGWTTVSLTDQKATWPDGADVTIGGRPAYYSPGVFLNELLIEVDPGVLWLVVTGFDGDVQAALTTLGELAVPRVGSLPPPEQPAPAPDIALDAAPDLEALFPTTIGGQALDVSSLTGADAIVDPEDQAAVNEALASMGKSVDDLSFAFAFAPAGAVAAIRVAGADAAAVLPVLMQATEGADVEMTPAQVAGKDVTLIASDTPYYAYPAGEVVWRRCHSRL